jgi:hypothetical protein
LYVNNCKKKHRKSYLLLKLTYYVVGNNEKTIFHLQLLFNGVPPILLPKLVLPKASINFDDASPSLPALKGKGREGLAVKHIKDFKGKSGVYL